MSKSRNYNEYEGVRKISDLVNYCQSVTNSKTYDRKSIYNWLNLHNKKSPYKEKYGAIIQNDAGEYRMTDVKKMLLMDKNINIDFVFDYFSNDEKVKRAEEYQWSIFLFFPFLYEDKYDSDADFRANVDLTVNQIKTAITLNIMMNISIDISDYQIDDEIILASAYQHVVRDSTYDSIFPVTIKEIDENILTGNLEFFTKKGAN